MGGHRILRNVDQARQLSGGHACRFTSHEQPERIETSRLSQCRQGNYDFAIIHISKLPELGMIGKTHVWRGPATSNERLYRADRSPDCGPSIGQK